MSPEDVEDLKALLDEAFAGVRSDLRKLAEAVKAFGDAIERSRAQMAAGFASIGSELTGTHNGISLPHGHARDDAVTE